MFGLFNALVALTTPLTQSHSLHRFLQREFRQAAGDDKNIRYSSAFVDLNGDRRDEALVYLVSNDFCGTGGCNLYIYTRQGRSWRKVSGMTITRPPIRVLNTRSHGWRDLSVFLAEGGIIPGYHVQMRFDGRRYPSNPSMPPSRRLKNAVSGKVLIGRNEAETRLY